jgi:GDPmannose 4,6-dehydratase
MRVASRGHLYGPSRWLKRNPTRAKPREHLSGSRRFRPGKALQLTRKITRAAARIRAGLQETLYLGNLDSVRDWGYAPEYVEGMWLMLQAEVPSDYVLATGVGATVRDFADSAFRALGLDYREHVQIDATYLRPAEVDRLIGDASRSTAVLSWTPKTAWKELAILMAQADRTLVEEELAGLRVRVDH